LEGGGGEGGGKEGEVRECNADAGVERGNVGALYASVHCGDSDCCCCCCCCCCCSILIASPPAAAPAKARVGVLLLQP